MAVQLTLTQLRHLRLKAQRLGPHLALDTRSADQVVTALTALQAQDPYAAELSLWARSSGLTQADVESALFSERSIVRTWCLRGTLHWLAAEDLGWLLALVGPTFIAGDRGRRLALGLDEPTCQRGLAHLREILTGQGAQTRAVLAKRLAERGLHLEGQALPHLLARAALEGLICLGPGVGSGVTYLLLAEWVKLGDALPRAQALGRLAQRYLSAYAPAAPEDLAAWSGLTLGEARAGWQMAASELVEVTYQTKPLWLLTSQAGWLPAPDAAPEEDVRLLPAFDTFLLGYKSREATITPQHMPLYTGGGGMLHPLALVAGEAAASWRLVRRTRDALLEVKPFHKLSILARAGVDREAEDLARFLGKTVKVSIL